MANTSHYSPSVFTLVPMSTLSKQHFELHPIWSEYYDFDEREDIVAWGVDSQWLTSERDRIHSGSDHCAYPILRPYPLPERMRLFIRAQITTNDGRHFLGSVMNEDAYVLSVFANEEEFCFSRNAILSDLNEVELERLSGALGCSPVELFPLKYQTDFLDSQNKPIEGIFSLSERAA